MANMTTQSAGGVVCRLVPGGRFEVLLVGGSRREPDYWGFPKGTQEAGEAIEATAIREVREETGVCIELLALAGITEYTFTHSNGTTVDKTVRLYVAYPIGRSSDAEGVEYREVAWLPSDQAHQRLTYDSDREVLSSALRLVEQNPLYQKLIAG
ncbi:MAG: NUDIX domain-containing protein [Anaerolineae bacterium]|nr:NUDIX domain-containing protein [Anaerolineae bacterium]